MTQITNEDRRLVRSFAGRVARRINSMTHDRRDIDDIEQECWVAWCLANKAYNPESGVPFGAYLMNGMKLHMNRYVEKNIGRRTDEVFAVSLDQSVNPNDDQGEDLLGEMIAAEIDSPLVALEEADQFVLVCKLLTPRARQFVEILYRQPEAMLAEVRALGARSELGHTQGITVPFSNRLTSSMVFKLMGVTSAERTSILREIDQVTQKVIGRAATIAGDQSGIVIMEALR